MTSKPIFQFVGGFLTAALIAFVYYSTRPSSRCTTGDLALGLLGKDAALIENALGDWTHNVHECHVGDLVVDVPAKPGGAAVLVGRDGKPLFAESNGTTTVMDQGHVVYERNRGRNWISVSAYDPGERAWIENVDADANGTIDLRITEFTSGAAQKREVRMGDRWFEVIKRNGRSGTLVDGRFMSLDEAREKLERSKPGS
jgi:hypothetical protein